MSNPWIHTDSINGKRIHVSVGQYPYAAPDTGLRAELVRYQAEKQVNCLLLAHGLVWGTSRPATIVAPQVLNWDLNQKALLVWPMDNALWSCELLADQSKYVRVDTETEAVEKRDSLGLRLKEYQYVLVVPGGTETAYMEELGYPPTDDYSLSPKVTTASAALVFAKNKLIHKAHLYLVAGLMAIAGFGYFLSPTLLATVQPSAPPAATAPKPVPQGAPDLGPTILALIAAIEDTEVLSLYGLSRMTYEGGALTLTGSAEVLDRRRIETLAKGWGATLDSQIGGTAWTMTFPINLPDPAPSRELSPMEPEQAALVALAQYATLTVAVTPVQKISDFAFLQTEVSLTSQGYHITGQLRSLADSLGKLKQAPVASIKRFGVAVSPDGQLAVAMSIVVKGIDPNAPLPTASETGEGLQ